MRQAVRGVHGAVAAGSEYATEAGMRIYYHGGNAVDAGVAAMFAASVTEFSHFGMGGEAPILIRTKAGKVYAIAGVGTMPKLATAELFRKRPLQPARFWRWIQAGLKGIIPVAGLMPALVPGMVDAGLVALREFGTKSFAEVIAPAIELADGFAIDEMRARRHRRQPPLLRSVADLEGALHARRTACRMPGEIFRQPDTGAHAARHGGGRKEGAGRGSQPRRPPSTPCAITSIAAKSRARSTHSCKANSGLLRYEDMAAFKLHAGRAGFDHLSRLQRLQARLLEPGSGDDRSAEHSGRLRHAIACRSIRPNTFTARWRR